MSINGSFTTGGSLTVGEGAAEYFSAPGDPSIIGRVGTIGSFVTDTDTGLLYRKFGLGDFDWSPNNNDAFAIHTNIASEIEDDTTEKVDPANADIFLIEDSEDSFSKKKTTINRASKQLLSGTVAASITATIDTITLSVERDKQWRLYTEITGKKNAVNILALEDSGTVSWSNFGRIKQGGAISYTINLTSDGTNMELDVTNNEAETLTWKLERQR